MCTARIANGWNPADGGPFQTPLFWPVSEVYNCHCSFGSQDEYSCKYKKGRREFRLQSISAV